MIAVVYANYISMDNVIATSSGDWLQEYDSLFTMFEEEPIRKSVFDDLITEYDQEYFKQTDYELCLLLGLDSVLTSNPWPLKATNNTTSNRNHITFNTNITASETTSATIPTKIATTTTTPTSAATIASANPNPTTKTPKSHHQHEQRHVLVQQQPIHKEDSHLHRSQNLRHNSHQHQKLQASKKKVARGTSILASKQQNKLQSYVFYEHNYCLPDKNKTSFI